MSRVPTIPELETAWEALCRIHGVFLRRHGVRLPSKKRYQWVWLATLHQNNGQFVHKDIVSEAVRQIFPAAAADQQVRHLKRSGWNIESDGKGGHKLDPYKPSTEFVNDQARRRGRLNATDFEDLKVVYGNRCATCGAYEGEPDPRYGDDPVELQQGHQDPEKPLGTDDWVNVIPQCQFCNRAYLNDFTFDDKGRVRAIASTRPVSRASKEVRRRVRSWLQRNPDE